MLSEGLAGACKADRRWRKVLQMHGKNAEVKGRSNGLTESWMKSYGRTKSWQKVPLMQGMLTDGLSDAQKVDRSWQNVHTAVGPSVNFLCIRGIFCQLPSIFWAPAIPSVRFCQLSVNPRDHAFTFCTPTGPSVKLLDQSFDWPWPVGVISSDYCHSVLSLILGLQYNNSPLSNFCKSVGPSMNFHQLTVHLQDLLSTCINFSCISGTFNQLSVHPWDFPSTPINSQCIRKTMHQIFVFSHLQYTFRADAGPSVNLCQLFMHQWDIQSTFCLSVVPSVNFPCVRGTCQLCSTSPYHSVVPAVQQSFLPLTHEIFSYDSCYFHYSVVQAVRLCWTSLN